MIQLRYLVTGTGRSGTVGMAAALTAAGIPCSHERFFNGNSLEEALVLMETHGGENSRCSQHCGLPEQGDEVVAESSNMAAPFLDAPCFAPTTVIHVVRNPWKVILSYLNNIQFFRGEPAHEHERFVYSVLPQLREIGNLVDRAVYFYIRWNGMIETLARKRERGRYLFHRIEDGPEALVRKMGLAEELGGRCQKKNDVNAFKEWPGELKYLAPVRPLRVEHINASNYAAELRELAKRYGYEVQSREEAPGEPDLEEPAPSGAYGTRFAQVPHLLEAGYHGYNLVFFRNRFLGLPQVLGTMDVARMNDLLAGTQGGGGILAGASLVDLKERVVQQVLRELTDGQQALQARQQELSDWVVECQAFMTRIHDSRLLRLRRALKGWLAKWTGRRRDAA